MKRIFLLMLVFAFVQKVQAQLQVNFYLAADQDDWQLFMAKKVWNDLGDGSGNNKAVIITLTAGDAGNGANAVAPATVPYYLARETGAVHSSKFISDINLQPIYSNTYPVPTAQNVITAGKTIVKYEYGQASGVGKVVNYFLRLPDGGALGNGFAGTGLVSLKKLKEGSIPNITSVDGANTYTWNQLMATIVAIIFAESGSDPQVWLNTPSLNVLDNPNDHSDHKFASTAAQEAVASHLAVGINEFVMDHTANLIVNVNNEAFSNIAGAFGVYNYNLVKNRYANTLNATTFAWIGKEYFDVKRIPFGALPISLLDFTGKLKGNNVLLEWSTSSESNSKEFVIERSDDGSNYRRLNSIPAAGNSSTTKTYSYLDIEATALNYYRLKMTDLDGSFKMSNVVIVKNNGAAQDILYVTNPFADQVNIRFKNVPKGKVSVRLMDVTGKTMGASVINSPLSSVVVFDDYPGSLSTGLYILQVSYEGKMYSYKLLKQ